jgi:ADP-ribosylation factor protein 1
MSSFFSNMFGGLFGSPERKCFLAGPDNAGKTSILYKLKFGEVMPTTPTIGFNVVNVHIVGLNLAFWDVGGSCNIRPLWRHYYPNTDVLIYVADLTDDNTFGTMHCSNVHNALLKTKQFHLQENLSKSSKLLQLLRNYSKRRS